MPWFAMLTALSYSTASKANKEAWRRHKAMHEMDHRHITGIHDINLGAPRSGKCKYCGSVEFRRRGALSVCTYCRTPE